MLNEILNKENVILNRSFENKQEAIVAAGKVLVEKGYVEQSYVEKMIEREELTTTYIGNSVAIPHGTEEAKNAIISSGISVIQVPAGVDFGNGNVAKLIIGIAGKNNTHLDILSNIAIVCSEEENVEKIVNAASAEEIIRIFSEEE
jgi:PTS system mannitol-specific IIA component